MPIIKNQMVGTAPELCKQQSTRPRMGAALALAETLLKMDKDTT